MRTSRRGKRTTWPPPWRSEGASRVNMHHQAETLALRRPTVAHVGVLQGVAPTLPCGQERNTWAARAPQRDVRRALQSAPRSNPSLLTMLPCDLRRAATLSPVARDVTRRSPTSPTTTTSQPHANLAGTRHAATRWPTHHTRMHRLPTTSCHNLHRIASHCTSFVIRVTSHDVHPRWRVRSGLQSHCHIGRVATRWHTLADVRSAIMADICSQWTYE